MAEPIIPLLQYLRSALVSFGLLYKANEKLNFSIETPINFSSFQAIQTARQTHPRISAYSIKATIIITYAI